jgi:hypothetical protein
VRYAGLPPCTAKVVDDPIALPFDVRVIVVSDGVADLPG